MDMRWGDAPAESQESLVRAFLDDISDLGYAAFDAFCIDPDTVLSPVREGNWAVASYDLGIVRDYMTDGVAAICPALAEAGRSLRPYDYVALLESQADNASARWQRRLLRLFGVNHAWLVPMSSLRFIKGVTVYMTGRGETAAQRFLATRDEIHLKAIHFFEALEATGPTIPEDMAGLLEGVGPLTNREAECLGWAAQGKTNCDIAAILGISENTVRYHFKNVLAKLGARTRVQAVALFRSPRVPGNNGPGGGPAGEV
ncbi:MAG: helix-turn-helix transcriptional regulator [Methyloceanibacter sp.]|uniref:helix-turn-helix transcriptional regulator n=1 Tax=Methyloceanibacter sp. TaxID=1965321 RepID=UPI003D6D94D9